MRARISRRRALRSAIVAATVAALPAVSAAAGAAQPITPQAALDRLFSAATVDPAWFGLGLLQRAPIAVIRAQILGLHGVFGLYRSSQVAADGTFVATFDGGTVSGSVALDDQGRFAALSTGSVSYALAADEQEISFTAGSLTLYGTLLVPSGVPSPPAALILAGSGPTDRNGNSRLLPFQLNTLSGIARALANGGVASFRFDKLGTGRTGLGELRIQPDFQPYVDAAVTGYQALALRPEVDASRLLISGHSEGGLLALIAAQQLQATQPPAALLLAAPLSDRALNTLRRQELLALDFALSAGRLSQGDHDQLVSDVDRTIAAIRAGGTIPDDAFSTAPALRADYPAGIEPFLRAEDSFDPAEVAAALPPALAALIVHGDQDRNVTDDEIAHLLSGFVLAGNTAVQWDEFPGVGHDLALATASSGAPLQLSADVAAAIAGFAAGL